LKSHPKKFYKCSYQFGLLLYIDIDAPFFLVLMIVFITPTANNVMVMVELSGSASKEGMARVIGIQYLCSPIILSVTVAVVVNVASQWMHDSIDGGVGETYHLLA